MLTSRQVVSAAGLAVFTAAFCAAQSIAPSHSGTVDYFEGDVRIDGTQLVSQVARFSSLKDQGVLKTGLGRAEILLTPGVILRVGENSSVRMLDSDLLHTRVEILSGSAMLEASESGTTVKDPPVTIVYKDFEAQAVKFGIFEITSEPSQLRVFKGESRVTGNGTSVNVKDGNRIDLTMTMATSKFDVKVADDLYLWSRDRSAYLTAANLSSARALATGNGSYSSLGWNANAWGRFSGGWYYNSYLNTYSFMPFAGTLITPFGYEIFNPMTIGYIYTPGVYWSGAGGARTSTTAGVPITSRSGAQQLPRMGVTATLHPVISEPLRGTTINPPSMSYAGRNNAINFGNPNAGLNNTFSNFPAANAPLSAPVSSSPAMSAPAPAMSAPAAAAPSHGAIGHR